MSLISTQGSKVICSNAEIYTFLFNFVAPKIVNYCFFSLVPYVEYLKIKKIKTLILIYRLPM